MQLPARILQHRGDRPALDLDGRLRCYAEVIDTAFALAAVLDVADSGPTGLVAILAHKSFSAYVAALAAHLAGKGYVPLNIKFPPQRLASMLCRSGAGVVVVGSEGLGVLGSLLEAVGPERQLTVVGAETESFGGLPGAHPTHRFLSGRASAAATLPRPCRPDATAYLLFTSGSTGQPKGVPVSFANLDAYLSNVARHFPLEPTDRASQSFDMTFDLSVHDLFATWSAGACLCPVGDTTLVNPARFIRDQRLTAWFSVPSVAMFMARGRSLQPQAFPSLRLSLFCGEPLPVATAEAWCRAAPNSRLISLYGPTETTIAIAQHQWGPGNGRDSGRNGLVPIGRVFPTQRYCLLAAGRQVVSGPGRGELCLSGSQVTSGYLNALDKTSAQFVHLPEAGPDPWYRTGDLVEEDDRGVLHFIGRIDLQVKVNGYRIELGEVESVLREASGYDGVAAVPWPAAGGTAAGLVAFILGEASDDRPLFTACRKALPDYMVPTRIIWTRTLPLNANGKVDRNALIGELDRQQKQGEPPHER